MTALVFLVLAILWGGILLAWLRSRSDGNFSDSVGTFRRHLHVLERAAPNTVRPANRMAGPSLGLIPAYRAPTSSRPSSGRYGASAQTGSRLGAHSPSAQRRRQGQKRRRDVFLVLIAMVGVTLLAAVGTGSHLFIYAQLLSDALLGGYVALLVRMRSLAAEREMKLSYLPASRPGTLRPPSRVYQPSVLPSYAEIALQPTAN